MGDDQRVVINVGHANITPPRQFDYTEGSRSSAAARWQIWTREMEVFLAASAVTDDKLKVYTLLNQAGPDLQGIYYTKWPDKLVYKTVVDNFTAYFEPQKSVMLARVMFGNMFQGERGYGGESIDDFATRLRQAAVTCEFNDTLERDIKLQLFRGTNCEKLRRELMASKDSDTTDTVIAKARERIAVETSVQTGVLGLVKPEPIGAVGTALRTSHYDGGRGGCGGHGGQGGRNGQAGQGGAARAMVKGGRDNGRRCFKCNRAYPHVGKCPALGQKCRECNGFDHFSNAKECPKNKMGSVNHVDSVADHRSMADHRLEKWSLGGEIGGKYVF